MENVLKPLWWKIQSLLCILKDVSFKEWISYLKNSGIIFKLLTYYQNLDSSPSAWAKPLGGYGAIVMYISMKNVALFITKLCIYSVQFYRSLNMWQALHYIPDIHFFPSRYRFRVTGKNTIKLGVIRKKKPRGCDKEKLRSIGEKKLIPICQKIRSKHFFFQESRT